MLRKRTKTCWLRIRIICPSGAKCLPADYKNSTRRVGLV